MSLPRYVFAAALDRASVLRPVARARERLRAARAPEPAGPPADGLPLPPASLRVLVTKTDPEAFLTRGRIAADTIAAAAPVRGTVLDFGCGCGRVLRHWAGAGLDLHGCDVSAEAVAWVEANLPFAEARQNPLEPPAPYPDATFDLIYALSIVTHLSVPLGERWVADWTRMLKPSGTLVVTTMGSAYRDTLGRKQRVRYDAGEPVVKGARAEGMNACAAHHPPAYMRALLAGFAVTHHEGDPLGFPQDLWVGVLP